MTANEANAASGDHGATLWHGRFEGAADEIASGHARPPGRRPSPAMEDFTIALDALLREKPRAAADEVRELAESLEVPWSTAKAPTTKRRLGVRTYQSSGVWWWEKLHTPNESTPPGD